MMNASKLLQLEALIGKPYRLGSNGPDAYDCAGLAREVQRILGVTIDIPERRVPEDLPRLIRSKEASNWSGALSPRHGDLVVMANVLERQRHLGVYLIPSVSPVVIHAHEKLGVICDDIPALLARGFNELAFYRRIANEGGATRSNSRRTGQSLQVSGG